jgi:segregation and condensation protein A
LRSAEHQVTGESAVSESGSTEAALASGGGVDTAEHADFHVTLGNFDGPFDLLLRLIGKREMLITDVALAAVTSEFIDYVSTLEGEEGLDQASQFVVVAATLLDMKVVGLLPQGDYVDAEDVKVLEARDLLFARLLEYRAFKDVSWWFATRLAEESRRNPRVVPLESHYRDHTRTLRWTTSVEDFHALALMAFAPKTLPGVSTDHLHAPLVSVREQAIHVLGVLRGGQRSFRELIAGVSERGVVVARFLAILELYRQGALSFHQLEPLGELSINLVDDSFSDDQLASLGQEWSHPADDTQAADGDEHPVEAAEQQAEHATSGPTGGPLPPQQGE